MNGFVRGGGITLILRSLRSKRLEGWANDASFETRSFGTLLTMRGVRVAQRHWSAR